MANAEGYRNRVRRIAAALVRYTPAPGRWRLTRFLSGEPQEPEICTVRVPKVGIMRLDLSSYLEREIFVTGTHGEEGLVGRRLVEFLADRTSTFVDVGANVGYHTLRVAKSLQRGGGRVVAFEPIRANWEALVQNVDLNRLHNVRVERLGLSDQNETVHVSYGTTGSSNVSLASTGPYSEEVELTTFDEWANRNTLDRVDLIKLDIEGAEAKALRGMKNVLETFRPILVLEINPMWSRRMGTSPGEILLLLKEHGYAVFDVKYHGRRPGRADRITRVDPRGTREVNAMAFHHTTCRALGIEVED